MSDNLFIDRKSNQSPSIPKPTVKGNGCVSTLAVGITLGLLVSFATFLLGYPPATIILSGVGTLFGIMVLHFAVTLLYLGFFAFLGLLGAVVALFFMAKSKRKR